MELEFKDKPEVKFTRSFGIPIATLSDETKK